MYCLFIFYYGSISYDVDYFYDSFDTFLEALAFFRKFKECYIILKGLIYHSNGRLEYECDSRGEFLVL